jgi:hypothetical protein
MGDLSRLSISPIAWGLPEADFDHRRSRLDTKESVFGFAGRYNHTLNGYQGLYAFRGRQVNRAALA